MDNGSGSTVSAGCSRCLARCGTEAQFPSYARNATHATQGRCVEKYAREYATHAREYATTEILRNEYATDATEYARTEKIRNEYATHAREYASRTENTQRTQRNGHASHATGVHARIEPILFSRKRRNGQPIRSEQQRDRRPDFK